MEWLIAVLVIAVLGVAAVVSSGGMGEMSREPVIDVYRQDLPDTPLTGEDVETLRFGIALRGYAMGQVDDVLARLAGEIDERDAVIASLRAQLGGPADHGAWIEPGDRSAPGERVESVVSGSGEEVR